MLFPVAGGSSVVVVQDNSLLVRDLLPPTEIVSRFQFAIAFCGALLSVSSNNNIIPTLLVVRGCLKTPASKYVGQEEQYPTLKCKSAGDQYLSMICCQ